MPRQQKMPDRRAIHRMRIEHLRLPTEGGRSPFIQGAQRINRTRRNERSRTVARVVA